MTDQSKETKNQMGNAIVGELLDTTLEEAPSSKLDTSIDDEVIALAKRGGRSEADAALQALVDEHLDTAVKENGYIEIITWDASRVALDMVETTKEFENHRPSDLVRYIHSWQERNGGNFIEVTWQTSRHRSQTVRVPQVAIAMVEHKLIAKLIDYGDKENKRANANALETMTLGRQLSIGVRALQGVRGVFAAIQNLRRFGGNPNSNNPLEVYAKGYLAMQDATELDAAVAAASRAMEQLEKEYPEDR